MFMHASALRQRTRAIVTTGYRTLISPSHGIRSAAVSPLGLVVSSAQLLPQRRRAPLLGQLRGISVSPTGTPIATRSTDIPRPPPAAPMLDLAADMVAALESSQTSPALIRWSERVGRLANDCRKGRAARHVGVIYADGLESQAALVADTSSMDLAEIGDISFDLLAASAASMQEGNVFADWLFDCDRIVVVAGSTNIVQKLTSTDSFRQCLQLHPHTSLVLSGLDASPATVEAFSGLLRESLSALGMPMSSLAETSCWITPADALLGGDRDVLQLGPRDGDSAALLANAMRAIILCAEHGGTSVFAPVSSRLNNMETVASTSSAALLALVDSTISKDPNSLSPLSKRIQDSFESSDLLTVDSSNGAVKRRIRAWFASGKVWQAVLMRVYEVSDNLIDNAVLKRSLEEAELGMIHAAGRLDGSIRHTASELANGLDRLHQSGSSEAELLSARNALRALAVQTEAVDRFVLVRPVWNAREKLADADECLDGIPRYIRWSLAQFWTINASAIVGATASAVYFNAPLAYAASGFLGLSMLALVWLGRRWRRLEANIYQHLDARYAALRLELANAYSQALLASLDRPLQGCTKKLTTAMAAEKSPSGGAIASATIAAWKSRLETAMA
ncbi:hypothetical protein GGH94_002815 [Coemansia aciculifera]|uniref:Uncharacterized protein n=1 Tax=Coemansia aciculifera TaxID=417176 RepID=A0A9W8IS98_9FUNG|nr:hypothetical protein GGH94_002815 [Coemansia aciculifera]KAJ2874155.1 hypothetical protein GGH93_002651 [Coemansia aciculifera]